MGLFGWSYPPGCHGTPYDEDRPCSVCGREEDNCICPECPVCGSVGDPACYKDGHMTLTKEQIDSLAEVEAQWAADAKAEAEAIEQMIKEQM